MVISSSYENMNLNFYHFEKVKTEVLGPYMSKQMAETTYSGQSALWEICYLRQEASAKVSSFIS